MEIKLTTDWILCKVPTALGFTDNGDVEITIFGSRILSREILDLTLQKLNIDYVYKESELDVTDNETTPAYSYSFNHNDVKIECPKFYKNAEKHKKNIADLRASGKLK